MLEARLATRPVDLSPTSMGPGTNAGFGTRVMDPEEPVGRRDRGTVPRMVGAGAREVRSSRDAQELGGAEGVESEL